MGKAHSFFGYCANCAGPRWTIGTDAMPISCMHCYHPVLTQEQVSEWYPDIAAALDSFVHTQQDELLQLMLDAKEGTEGGYVELFQSLLRSGLDPHTLSDYVQYAIELQKEVPLMNQMYEYEQKYDNQHLDPRMVLNDTFSENKLHSALVTPVPYANTNAIVKNP